MSRQSWMSSAVSVVPSQKNSFSLGFSESGWLFPDKIHPAQHLLSLLFPSFFGSMLVLG